MSSNDRRAPALLLATALLSAAPAARADDAGTVARAREQVESGAYPEALRTLSALKANLPAALAIEAGLLEATAALVVKGDDAGQAACARAVVAAGYDPEVARDQSPKVRAACRAAAVKERKARLDREKIQIADLAVDAPEVAWQPVRVSASASNAPAWLRVVARVTSSALEGSFDLVLAPSVEGPLRGTLDPSWIRPKAKIQIQLVTQDRFGDLAPTGKAASVDVPAAEALITLGSIPSGATLLVDGAAVSVGPDAKAAVAPGKHKVVLELGNGASSGTSIDVERGAVARVALSPQKGGVGWPWILGAGAVALGGVGTVFLVQAASKKSEIEELSQKREPGTMLPATSYSDLQQKDQERKTFAAVGIGLGAGAGACAIAALTVALWPSGGGKKKARVIVQPSVGIGSASLSGSF